MVHYKKAQLHRKLSHNNSNTCLKPSFIMSGKVVSIFFICILSVALDLTEANPKLQDYIDECAVENGYPSNKYENVIALHLDVKLDYCVAACAMRKVGTLIDGVYTGENVLPAFPSNSGPSDTEKLIIKCAEQHGSGQVDDCKTVENLHDCLSEDIKKVAGPEVAIEASINHLLLYTE